MPNTDRARAWLEMLRQSDNLVLQIFTMAVAAVMLWAYLRRLHEPAGRYMRLAFLSSSLGLFVYVITGGAMLAGGSAAALFVVGALAGSAVAAWAGGSVMAAWDWRRPWRRKRDAIRAPEGEPK